MSKITIWDLFEAAKNYDGSPTAHSDVVNTLKKHGHKVSMSDAWCSETVMAILYDAGGIDMIGYAPVSGSIKKHAQQRGIWHSGSNGILPGDIVIFGRNGKTNHSELVVGDDVDLSGNYNGGCSRRKMSTHSSTIFGYVRLDYAPMPIMNNQQVAVIASECILGTFGSDKTRERLLSVFGSKNAELIQKEVDKIAKGESFAIFDLAVYAISGFAGKDKERKKRLGKWYESVQNKINNIYKMKGKSTAEVVDLIIQGKFGNDAIRKMLLEFCGYNADKIQKEVNKKLATKK